ncbi:MAG: phosphoribosyl-AMP cyclohydrolase [Endozoicomonas sp.]
MSATDWLDEVKWNDDGLVAAIAQDVETRKVLMQAWMNRESLALSIQEQVAIYWSRSRNQLWRKGESSGHTQKLVECRLDCDGDALLLVVEQQGGIACHTGRKSCFYRRLDSSDGGVWQTEEPVLKDPESIYGDR